jgi:hypothetical protein
MSLNYWGLPRIYRMLLRFHIRVVVMLVLLQLGRQILMAYGFMFANILYLLLKQLDRLDQFTEG